LFVHRFCRRIPPNSRKILPCFSSKSGKRRKTGKKSAVSRRLIGSRALCERQLLRAGQALDRRLPAQRRASVGAGLAIDRLKRPASARIFCAAPAAVGGKAARKVIGRAGV